MARTLLALTAIIALTGCGPHPLAGASAPDALPQVAAGWTSVQVTPSGMQAIEPCLIERKSGGYAIAFGSDKLGDRHLYLTTSADGVRWTAPVSVAKGPLSDESPALYEDDAGKLHVLFASNRTKIYELYETTSPDGAAWTDAQALPDDADQAYRPAVASLSGGSLALAYETLGGAVKFRTRTSAGTWSEATTVQTGGGDATLAATPDGKLTLAYKSYQKLYVRTRSAQGTWTTPAEVPSESAETPSLASDGKGGLWMLYAQMSGDVWNLSERKSDGTAWSEAQGVTTGQTDDEHPSALVTRSGEQVMAWGSSSEGTAGGIFFARRR